jgi:hypothetical protein
MSETAAAKESRQQSNAEQWAYFAADSYAEIAVLHAGNDDSEHRAKVREAHERALARGSDVL